MARILALAPELMSGTRISETLTQAGHEVSLGDDPAAADGYDVVVCDLTRIAPEAVAGSAAPVIGFYPHVEVQLRRRAEEAGIALAVSRKRFFRDMPELVRAAAEGSDPG